MDELINDAQEKNLLTVETTGRSSILANIFMATKDMSKMDSLTLEMYWCDYIDIHGDYCGFIIEED